MALQLRGPIALQLRGPIALQKWIKFCFEYLARYDATRHAARYDSKWSFRAWLACIPEIVCVSLKKAIYGGRREIYAYQCEEAAAGRVGCELR